jgi:hypothetical protein
MGVIEIWREMRMMCLSISIDFVVCLTIGGVWMSVIGVV